MGPLGWKGASATLSASPRSNLTGEGGFEPPLTDPESAVLPLDDSPPVNGLYYTTGFSHRQGMDPNLMQCIRCRQTINVQTARSSERSQHFLQGFYETLVLIGCADGDTDMLGHPEG